jgi:predicted nucleic acid-binding Zn ribbon protein
VHFKGSGFYTTDYGRGSGKKPSKDGDSPSSEPAKPKEEKKKAAEA